MSERKRIVEFLEEFPLYRKFEGLFPDYQVKAGDFHDEEVGRVAEVTIEQYCRACKMSRSFASLEPRPLRQKDTEPDPESWADPHIDHAIYSVSYRCTHCSSSHIDFILLFDYGSKFVQKIGQNPPWSIAVGKDVERFLGNDVELLERGKICESQGYGIAAFVYYRRVVENVIGSLLSKLESLVPDPDRERYSQALLEIKESQRASEKIQVVKDLLPSSLRPDGRNPLGILYGAVSQGLHDGSDDECLKSAAQIHACITYLVQEISAHDDASREFTDNLQRLLDKAAEPKRDPAVAGESDV